jgi:hypothetical protein
VVDGALVGDVDFESARRVASAITPVPGGVGPLTNALLLAHLVRAARRQEEVARGQEAVAGVPSSAPADRGHPAGATVGQPPAAEEGVAAATRGLR